MVLRNMDIFYSVRLFCGLDLKIAAARSGLVLEHCVPSKRCMEITYCKRRSIRYIPVS